METLLKFTKNVSIVASEEEPEDLTPQLYYSKIIKFGKTGFMVMNLSEIFICDSFNITHNS
jgi:hypothetical protein